MTNFVYSRMKLIANGLQRVKVPTSDIHCSHVVITIKTTLREMIKLNKIDKNENFIDYKKRKKNLIK